MSDNHKNPPGEQMHTTPKYRVRRPEGETTAPKSAENAATTPVFDEGAAPIAGDEQPAGAATTRRDTAKEIGGPKGPEPTRFGDWERNGRCVDF